MTDIINKHLRKEGVRFPHTRLRAAGSKLVSQFIDSLMFIAFYIEAGWDIKLVLAIGVVNYIYTISKLR